MAIKLVPKDDGTFRELNDKGGVRDITWIPDSYTEPRDGLFDCEACGKPIEEWNLWTCLDGGEAAHNGCVVIKNG